MASNALLCPTCHTEYNTLERLPKLLFKCGHTICLVCLSELVKSGGLRKCPFDDENFESNQNNADAFPMNFVLYHILEKKQQEDICKIHNQRFRFICFTDKTRICEDCAFDGDHIGHNIRSVHSMKHENDEKTAKLTEAMGVFENHQKSINSNIERERKLMQENLKRKFSEIYLLLHHKEFELLCSIDRIIPTDDIKIDDNGGIVPELIERMRKEIDYQTSIVEGNGFPKSLEDNNFDELLKMRNSAGVNASRDKVNETNERLKETLVQVFDEEKEALQKSTFILEEICMNEETKLNENDVKSSSPTKDLPSCLELLSPFCLRIREDSLIIAPDSMKKVTIKFESLTPITKVEVILGNYAELSNNFNIFYYLWNYLVNVTSVAILFDPASLSEDHINNILPKVLLKPGQIKDFAISIAGCDIGDTSIKLLFTQTMRKMEILESISLTFDNSRVTEESLNVFRQNVLPVAKNLRVLRIDLFDLQIYDNGIVSILKELPETVEELYLHLHNTLVESTTLDTLAKVMTTTLKNIKKLGLWLGKTKVADSGLVSLFESMNGVQELKLNLASTSVTDKSINVLVEVLLAEGKSLESLILDLKETDVSEEVVRRVYELQDGLNKSFKNNKKAG